MISVCMATYNGEQFIKEQLTSILSQLAEDDEVIISDDSSTDGTIDIINSFHDKRIRLFPNQKFHSPIFNFENALRQAKGDYIFLSDQDDVWRSDKVEVMLSYLSKYCLVLSNCSIIDKENKIIKERLCKGSSVHRERVLDNIIRNEFSGCRIAFRRELLTVVLPFPRKIAMHDIWIGLCASALFTSVYIPDTLVMYRRHGHNASFTGEKSSLPWSYRISYRLYFIYYVCRRYFCFKKRWKNW